MRPRATRRAVGCVWVLIAWAWATSAAWADPGVGAAHPGTQPSRTVLTPATPTAPELSAPAVELRDEAIPADPDSALRRALALERQRNWTAAIEVYEKALEVWPAQTEFRHRLRLCELHYKLGRRYQDQSFRKVLLRLAQDQALDLYDELLERVQTHYVDPVPLEPLLRHGLDNLEVALRDPTFLQANAAGAGPDRVQPLRDAYRAQRGQVQARDRDEAKALVLWACDQARQGLGLAPAAVVLEFVFGACDALDDYSCYLTPDRLDDLYAMIDGNFVGLGIELKLDPHGLRLVGVIRGGPAWEAGLKVGDKITHVADRPVRGLSLDEAASRLQGEENSAVAITVLRRDGTSKRLVLTRRPVEVESVAQARIVDSVLGVGYIQLSGFQKTSTDELDQAIRSLQRQGLRALVLDLRGNPGGLLNVAVEIADRFLGQGVIVSTKGRAPGQSLVYRAQPGVAWSMPLAILVDHDSASASEILAGALKDHHRATIVGERSYGKGSVQSIFSLRSAPAGLKLTTAKFYSPLNRAYSEQGVEPDVRVRLAARPAEGSSPEPTFEVGDPAQDPVLARALQVFQRQVATPAR